MHVGIQGGRRPIGTYRGLDIPVVRLGKDDEAGDVVRVVVGRVEPAGLGDDVEGAGRKGIVARVFRVEGVVTGNNKRPGDGGIEPTGKVVFDIRRCPTGDEERAEERATQHVSYLHEMLLSVL